MKRLFILVLLSLVATSLFAATDKTLNEKAFVEWEFEPEVSTYAGYNLDLGTSGLEGKAKLEITSKIYDKADLVFSEEQKPYGEIKVEDLEIKATAKQEGTGSTSEKYKTTDNANKEPLSISWGTISGTIYVGPVYIKLAHDGHGDQGFIEKGLDDGDLDYSVINYSILSASQTAQYTGARKVEKGRSAVPVGLFTYRVSDVKDESIAPNDALASQVAGTNNAFSIGFKKDKLVDVRVGVSSAGSYKTYQRNNPIQLSLFAELLAIENVIVKLQTTAIAGVHANTGRESYDDEGGFLTEGNPLTVGLLLGYKMPMGTNTLTPSLGAEVSLENKVGKFADLTLPIDLAGTGTPTNINIKGTKTGEDTETVDVMAYEVALGVKYDWKSLGYDEDEDDHLSAPDKDVTVTDGVALGLLYGALPNALFRGYNSNYVGAKVSLWDSQDDDKPGMFPAKIGLILNYNYVLGGEYEPEDFGVDTPTSGANPAVKANVNKVTLGSRQDFGLLLETSMTFGYIKPFLNTALRMYNITDATELEVETKATLPTAGTIKTEFQKLTDKADLRVKLGFDVVDLVKNVTFSAWWESGNVMKEDKVSKATYNAASTFYTTKNTISASNNAKLGFIALGAKIEY